MSSRGSPLWRRAFDRAEQAVGRPLEAATNSVEFFTSLLVAGRARRAVARRTDAVASWALHQARLPSTTDVRALQRQLAALQREVGALRRELSRLEAEAGERVVERQP
jgi:hypothetical protein